MTTFIEYNQETTKIIENLLLKKELLYREFADLKFLFLLKM